jgi:glycine dehydrogenase subunit 1
MTYLPHTDDERREMLKAIGVVDLKDLFGDVPERLRFPELELPPAASEPELAREMRELAACNRAPAPHVSFLGAGTYNHFSPATVDSVLRRGEFYTSYTPYQPELSQGMLQAMFEYQSMICRLFDMEVSNASHYDGATSLAEGVLLALDRTQGRRDKIVLSPGVHPQYREVVRTYLGAADVAVVGDNDPLAEPGSLTALLDDRTAALVIQTPNFLGQFEDVSGLADAVHGAGALLIVVVDPISLGLFQPPGAYGADVAVAEGQSLGIPPSFGGPHLGIFATRRSHVRRLMGRLVGETVDAEGQRGYVLTLGTREQHIRRAKATSNICTNAALVALGAAVYLATLGKRGLRQVAELCYHRSHYAAAEIGALPGIAVNPQAPAKPFFKEFVVALPKPAKEVNAALLDAFGIIGGYDLGAHDPSLERQMLLAVTELNARPDIDRLVDALRRVTA